MNEKPIQQVLEIEKKAQATYEFAVHEADKIPLQAEHEAQELIEKARQEALEEARKIRAEFQTEKEVAEIQKDTQEKIDRSENLAKSNFNRAVSYILSRVVGRE